MALELNATQIIIIFLVVLAFLFSSIIIDIITLIFVGLNNGFKILFKVPRKKIPPLSKAKVSIIIPAYNEEGNIRKVIESSFNQTLKPRKVIVIDDNSIDKTLEICKDLKKKYKNLEIISQKINRGKAYNVTHVLNNVPLSEITIVQDADTFLAKNYLEEIIKPFSKRKIVIVTGFSLPMKMPNFFGKVIFNGIDFSYKLFGFRKSAQSFRNSISVVTGDSAAYSTTFLKEVGGLPQGTVTEDMDITWLALEKGYGVAYQEKARADSKDASTIRGHWKQITRWFSGGFQCLIKHRGNLFKAKPLLFSTLLPSYFDAIIYSFSFLLAIPLLFIYPSFSIGFFAADLFFTLLIIIFLHRRGIFHLPEIYFIKFFWSLAWIYAGVKTGIEYLLGKRYWLNSWTQEGFYVKKKINKVNIREQ